MAQATTITKEEIQGLIQRCFADLCCETEQSIPVFAAPEAETHDQRRMLDERLTELRCQVRDGVFGPEVQATAAEAARQNGYDPELLPPGLMRVLVEGVARALAEQQRLFDFRLTDTLSPYEAKDVLFRGSVAPTLGPALVPSAPAQPVGPTVREAVDRYLKAKRKSWAKKTPEHRARQLRLLEEHLGTDRRLRTVTKDDMRGFRDGVLKFRRNHHVGASLTFTGRQTENESLRIEPKTALIHLQNVRSFLRWGVAEGYLDTDPSAGLQVELPKKAKTEKARRALTAAELEALFRAPLFVGCQSPRRRHDVGKWVIKDAQYWMPLLGYYTGARMGELVQLHLTDVHLDGAFPYIDITDAGGGESGSGAEKHVKSSAGVRQVPLHPHLIDLGFADFVKKRAGAKRPTPRLFFELEFGKDGQASSPYSKRFARVLDKLGLTDGAICFHSFRHGVEDALRNAKEPQYVIDRIIGHSDDAISAQYGEGVSLEVAAAAVCGMKLPIDARAIISA